MQGVGIEIAVAVVCLAAIAVIPAIGVVARGLFGCLFRWREVVGLQASGRVRHARDMAAVGMMPMFLLACGAYCLYFPVSWGGVIGRTLWCALAFAIFLAVRAICRRLFRLGRTGDKTFSDAVSCDSDFFIILCLVWSFTLLASGFLPDRESAAADVLKWELAAVYLLFLLRKTQIFVYYDGFFRGILYLCTLEMIPTGMLVISAYCL